MSDNDKAVCMLERITSFLIQVGEHCMSCEEKTVLKESIIPEKKKTIMDVTLEKELQEFGKYLEPTPKTCTHKRNVKISYLEKWIQNGSFETFTLEQFYQVYPKQRGNDRLNSIISDLIGKKIITQLSKDKFRVNGRK